MILWTIQHPEVWSTLQKEGVYHQDPAHEDEDFRESYKWMRSQFMSRVSGAQGRSLIWAWKTPKPDLRRHRWYTPVGEESVRLEFEIPDDRVLVSDYDMWHNVLNKFFVPLSKEEDDEHEASEEALLASWMGKGLTKSAAWKLVDAFHLEKVEKSWERIFDLDAMGKLFEDSYYGGENPLAHHQVVMEELRLEWVKKITVFKGARTEESFLRNFGLSTDE